MRTLLFASAAILTAISAPPLLAQTAMPATTSATASTDGYVMTAEQQTMYGAWDAPQRSAYDALPSDQRTYFWTLNPGQQTGYWKLTDDQRGMVYRMTPEQRTLAWQAVEAQMNGQTPATPMTQANPPGEGMPTTGVPNPSAAAQAVPPAMPADSGYQGGPYKGALTPAPADAMAKSYPVCSASVQDSCVNRGEAGTAARNTATRRNTRRR